MTRSNTVIFFNVLFCNNCCTNCLDVLLSKTTKCLVSHTHSCFTTVNTHKKHNDLIKKNIMLWSSIEDFWRICWNHGGQTFLRHHVTTRWDPTWMMKVVDEGLLFQMNTYLLLQWKHTFLLLLFFFLPAEKNKSWLNQQIPCRAENSNACLR